MNASRQRSLWILCVCAVLSISCVPNVSIEGAPCPCPNGLSCCESLFVCQSPGASCPEIYPASSGADCQKDSDCSATEQCQSWTLEDAIMSGSRSCRRVCEGGLSCAEGEVCELTPHDGMSLETLNVTQLCVSYPPTEVCASQGCAECGPDILGKTYCNGNQLLGCFIALHPECGITCELVLVSDCGPDGCRGDVGDADCTTGAASPCSERACENVCGPAGIGPGENTCVAEQFATCLSLPFNTGECKDACQLATQACPEPSVCVDDGVPTCE